MTTAEWISQLQANLPMAIGAVAALSVLLFVLARYVIARALTGLAARTKSKYDDILVRNLRPNRMAWFAPLLVVYTNAYLFPDYQVLIAKSALFVILWLAVLTLTGLLSAVNDI